MFFLFKYANMTPSSGKGYSYLVYIRQHAGFCR